MISYSTGESGSGADVDKVREATRIAKAKRPDLMLDGPLQYDAASMADVAATKAPDSPVAGRATVFIFPDLNTGNTTYKAVQRSANVISIGPDAPGAPPPGQRSLPRRARRGHRLHDRHHRHPSRTGIVAERQRLSSRTRPAVEGGSVIRGAHASPSGRCRSVRAGKLCSARRRTPHARRPAV